MRFSISPSKSKRTSSPIRSVALVHGLGDVVVATVSYRVRLAPKGNTAQAAHSRDHSSKIARAHVFSISFWPIQDQERPFAFVANPRDSIGDVDACTYITMHMPEDIHRARVQLASKW